MYCVRRRRRRCCCCCCYMVYSCRSDTRAAVSRDRAGSADVGSSYSYLGGGLFRDSAVFAVSFYRMTMFSFESQAPVFSALLPTTLCASVLQQPTFHMHLRIVPRFTTRHKTAEQQEEPASWDGTGRDRCRRPCMQLVPSRRADDVNAYDIAVSCSVHVPRAGRLLFGCIPLAFRGKTPRPLDDVDTGVL